MVAPGGRSRSGAHAFHGIRWFHIPISVGIGVLAFVQIRRMLKDGRRHRDRSGPTAWQVRSNTCGHVHVMGTVRRAFCGLYVFGAFEGCINKERETPIAFVECVYQEKRSRLVYVHVCARV